MEGCIVPAGLPAGNCTVRELRFGAPDLSGVLGGGEREPRYADVPEGQLKLHKLDVQVLCA